MVGIEPDAPDGAGEREGMRLVPVTLKQANAFVKTHHRHHGPVIAGKFGVGLEQDGKSEVYRCCTAGRPYHHGDKKQRAKNY